LYSILIHSLFYSLGNAINKNPDFQQPVFGSFGASFSPKKYFMLLQQNDGNFALWDVSSSTLPLQLWFSNTVPPESTWTEPGSDKQVS
jgi:hypothetical protein